MNRNQIMFPFLIVFFIVTLAFSQTSLLTGQSSYSLSLVPGVTLQYSGDMTLKAITRNEVFPVGWVGLGWKFGVPSISVIHNNTVDINDDRWFFNDGFDNVSEIIRVNQGSVDQYYLKNNPLACVTAYYDPSRAGLTAMVRGWTIVNTDGSTSHFGQVSGESATDALRYVPSWGNSINGGALGGPAGVPFYYRWDLKDNIDINGKKTTYVYQPLIGNNSLGFAYIRQSYISTITSPSGNIVSFILDPNPKTTNEGPSDNFVGDFDFSETRYLRTVTLQDKDLRQLERVDLSYCGDAGEVSLFNAGKKGFAKRLLTKVKPAINKGASTCFTYNGDNQFRPGYLTAVSNPFTGKTTSYLYYDQTSNKSLTDANNLSFPRGEYDNSQTINMGNHVFTLDCQMSGSDIVGTKIEILDKVRLSWEPATISGVTGTSEYLSHGKCFPGPNRFILDETMSTSPVTHKITVYEWIDDRWVQTFQRADFPFVNSIEFYQTNSYFLIFEKTRSIIYIYRKIKGVWTSTFNAPASAPGIDVDCGRDAYGQGWNRPEPVGTIGSDQGKEIHVAENYFIYSYRIYQNVPNIDHKRVLETFVWQGDANNDGVQTSYVSEWWVQTDVPLTIFSSFPRSYRVENGINYHYSDMLDIENTGFYDGDISFDLFRDYYVNTNTRTFVTYIRKFNYSLNRWDQLLLSASSLYTENVLFSGMRWNTSNTKVYAGQDYLVLLLPVSAKSDMVLYRYFSGDWYITYVKAISGCAVPSDGIVAKHFDFDIDYVVPSYGHFVAMNTATSFIYDFRWSDGSSIWESKFNGTGNGGGNGQADAKCQGYNFEFTAKRLFPNFDNLGIWYKNAGNDSLLKVYSYDYASGSYGSSETWGPFTTGKIRIELLNDVRTDFTDNTGGKQNVSISSRFGWQWTGNPVATVVSSVTTNGGTASVPPILTNYFYDGNSVQNFDAGSGIGFFSKVKSVVGNGAKGTTEYEFSVDSTTNVFGQMLSTSLIKTNPSVPGNTDVAISGWLFDLDGSTPKAGWVRVRLYDNTTSSICQIDPKTGRFSVAFPNPVGFQYSLDYLPTNTGDGYQIVFYANTSYIYFRNKYGRNVRLPALISDQFRWLNVRINFGKNSSGWCCDWNAGRNNSSLVNSQNFYAINSQTVGFFNTTSQPRMVQQFSLKDGVESYSIIPFSSYDTHNNMPSLSYKVNSDGKLRIDETIFAHEKYSGMGPAQANMLSQTAGSVTSVADMPAPNVVQWVDGVVHTITPPATGLYDLLTVAQRNQLAAGDKIGVSSSYTAAVEDPLILFAIKVNGTYKTVENRYSDGTGATGLIYELQSADIPITSLQLEVSQVDVTLTIQHIDVNVFKPIIISKQPVAASATTWTNDDGVWRPRQSYVWSVPMDATGIPTIAYSPFDFATPSLTPDFKLASAADLYNGFGTAIQSTKPLSGPSAAIRRNDNNQSIGSISPANFYESGAFTCDYDLNETGSPFDYFDQQNGWEKDAGSIVSDYSHFGQKCLKILNGQGVMRNFKARPSQDYKLSAWVNVPNGPNSLNIVVEYWSGPNPVITWPIQWTDLNNPPLSSFITSVPPTSGNWQFVKIPIPARTEANLWIRIHFGIAGQNILAYVDDIRFGPSKAQISTTYYDTLWQQPILSVGPDNNPGSLIEYDNFGRQSLTYKIDKNTNDLTVTSIKSYHLMNDPPLFDATKWYKILTKVDATRGVDIKDGNISIYEHQPLQLWQNGANDYQLWKFIPAGDGNYFIQTKANTAFYIDDPFKTLINGSQLQIWDGAGPNQKWNVVPLRDGCYRITPFASGAKAMEYNAPAGQAPANGLAVQLSSYKNKDNQKWRIVAAP